MTRMKDSGIEWIGEVPEEWGITKSKYFLDTNKGLTITKENLIEDGIPVINYGQIHSKYGRSVSTVRDELPQVSTNYLKFKQSLLNKGDFVFADTSEDIEGSGNFSTRIDDNGELFAGYHTIKAKLKNALEHDFRYFMHYFDSMAFRKQVQNKVSGIKVYSVTQSILQETCLLLPSFIEQQRIADFLDKKVAQLDKVKSLLEEQIKTLEDYRQSLIYETVTKGLDKTVPLKDSGVDWIGQIPEGWGVKPIKYCSRFQRGFGFPVELQGNDDGEIPFYKVSDLRGNSDEISISKNYVDLQTAKQNAWVIVPSGAIIAPVIGAALLNNNRKISTVPFISDNNTLAIIPNNKNKYFYYLFKVIDMNWFNNSSTIPAVNISKLANQIVPTPKEEEQKQIADFLEVQIIKIDKLIEIKQKQINNINQQRQTLIYDVVTGKRRV